MITSSNLYPPIVQTYMPAFLKDGSEYETTCRVYFSISPYNSPFNIQNVQVTIRDQNSNKTAFIKADYPSEIKIVALQEDNTRTTDRFFIEIPESDINGG